MLYKDTAVTELVTLCLKIKLSVKVAVDLGTLSEVNKNLPENTDTADPLELFGCTCCLATTAFTVACVAAKALCNNALCMACLGVHSDWTTNNDAITDKFADLLTGVCHGNGGNFTVIHPDTAETAIKDGSSKALLELQ